MRIHELQVCAFGPFGDTVTVDFDELGADGLFLLHGQTGAGKTTILDAVAFALYGRVPGARQDGKRLLSDHAPAGAAPRVVLEATIGGRRLRITRSPEYQRPKRRGAGTTRENAKATLEWLDGRGENLTRLDEIGELVSRLLGMSADQFFQVVLLPQGDFARFLRADSDERGVLLERLFDTGRFADVEDWLAGQRRQSESRIAGKKSVVDRLAAQVSAAAGIEAGADADPIAWSRRLVEETWADAEVAARALAGARDRARYTEEALALARERRQAQQRAERARTAMEEIAAGAAARAALTAERDAAVAAAPVSRAHERAQRAAQLAQQRLAEARGAAEKVACEQEGRTLVDGLSWPPAAADADSLADAARGWEGEVARLRDLIAREEQRRAVSSELDDARVRRAKLSDEIERLSARRAELPGEIERAQAELEKIRTTGSGLPALVERCVAAAERLGAATELVQVRAARSAAAERRVRARETHLEAREELATVRELRIAGMAAELAAQLDDETACPVCGSAQHPDPARPTPDAVSKNDEDAARAVEQQRARELDDASAQLGVVEQRVLVLAERAGDADPHAAAAAVRAAEANRTEVEAVAAEEPAAASVVAALRTEDDELADRAQERSAQLAALGQRIRDDEDRLAELDRTIAEATGSEAGLQGRCDRLDGLAQATRLLRDRRSEAAHAAGSAAGEEAEVAAAVATAGFADLAAAHAAGRPQQRIDEIDRELTAARDKKVQAEAVLADRAVQAAVAAGPVDLVAVETEHEAAVTVREDALRTATAADQTATNVARYARELAAEVAALGPVLRRHEELAALAEVIAGRGQNSRKMSLRSYVLAARLEEVALSASVRLRRMSGGRYEFVHEDGAGPRGKRGGLGLDIRDDYTGVVRSAKTLSGGESFLASLALALGLADVVAAESGGRVLDTIFIDEGFGTLDAETLESVMGVLDELREGGRVVGIVSHVDEMRQRIPSRLRVVRGRSGSRIEASMNRAVASIDGAVAS